MLDFMYVCGIFVVIHKYSMKLDVPLLGFLLLYRGTMTLAALIKEHI